MITVSKEDYLKAILEMEQEGMVPISARLSESLRVTPPAVTAALKRMSRDGVAMVDEEGRIRLTPKGRKAQQLSLSRSKWVKGVLHQKDRLRGEASFQKQHRLAAAGTMA